MRRLKRPGRNLFVPGLTPPRTRTEGFRMKSDRLISLLFVTTLVLFTPLPCIKAQIRIDAWTTDNGLPQNSVTGITKTPDGYIWFTTNEGLVRFDGVRFTVFNRSNTPEIANNRMSGAFADKSGTVWMSTEEGEILFYEKGGFTVAMKPGDIPSGVPSSFFRDPSGRVIFYKGYDNEKSLTQHYRYMDGKFVPLAIEGVPADSYLVLTDREDGLWFGGEKTLRRYKDGQVRSFDLGFSTGATNRRAYEDRQGSIWIGYAEGKKQFLINIKDGRINRFPLPSGPVTDFSEDARGNLWITLFNNGVYRIDKESVTANAPVNNLPEPVLLVDKVPKIGTGYLCPDNEGGMWVGTNEGLVRLTQQTIRVYSKQDGLPEENVYPVYEDRAGRIWAGIWENSLVRYENGSFKTFLRTNDTYYPTSLFEDGSGRFWLGTISGLYYLDKERLIKFTEQAGFSEHTATEFSVISQDRNNNLWFGTNWGLSRYSGTQATVFTKKDGLPDDYIIAFLQTSDGRIWVGTRGGLAVIENDNVRAFTTADGLASNYIRSLYEDSERVLWIGSYDGGLTRFKDGKFTRFTTKEGLSSNGVFCILEDDRGWFWMNSNQGIYRVRKQELNDFADGKIRSLTSIAYNRQDGLLNTEGNGGRQPAAIKARDGKLWFPTAQGIAVVDPETVMTNRLPPPVLIEEVFVDRNPVANETLQPAIHNQSEIVLAPNQSNLEINYTGISFINSGQVKFKYRLEGLDRDWNDVGTRRTAYYSYLPPGEYTFHIIAANRDGVWNTDGAFVKFRVLPPFYKTYWFIAACAALFLALLWMLYQLRVRQLRREDKRLRDVVEGIPAMAFAVHADGSPDLVNRRWLDYTGSPADATTGSRGWEATIHPDDAEAHLDKWRAALSSGEPFENEARHRSASGEYRWFLVRAMPLRDEQGKITKWYGALTDIEDRKRAEEERERLRRLEAELAHTNRVSMLGELTASLAHEINQPIAAAITSAGACLRWLDRDQPEVGRAREAAMRIESDGKRAADIIAHLKSFYKKDASPQREPVTVNEVIGEMLVLLHSEASRHSVVMRTELAAGLPSVRADRVQLQQVLMNLMLNAIEAMRESGGELGIRTRLEDGEVLVSVSDTGEGIPADKTEQIFNAFFTTKAGGTGMGLAISRTIIESHGGRLWAGSNAGRGATFHFTLPTQAEV